MPHKTALFALFRRERQYCVPLIQRPNAWSQGKQWEPGWAKVIDRGRTVLDHALAGRRGSVVRNRFPGAIVTRRIDVFGTHTDAAEFQAKAEAARQISDASRIAYRIISGKAVTAGRSAEVFGSAELIR